jgi:hypothetical protein
LAWTDCHCVLRTKRDWKAWPCLNWNWSLNWSLNWNSSCSAKDEDELDGMEGMELCDDCC